MYQTVQLVDSRQRVGGQIELADADFADFQNIRYCFPRCFMNLSAACTHTRRLQICGGGGRGGAGGDCGSGKGASRALLFDTARSGVAVACSI